MKTKRIKILIDPKIKGIFGPEVCWVWRLLLTSLGYHWIETNAYDEDCDIAYLVDLSENKKSRLCIQADINIWQQRYHMRFENIGTSEELSFPVFEKQDYTLPTISKNNGRITCDRDIVFDVFWLVTGQEEKYFPKDKHGFFDLSGTAFLQKKVLRLALASNIASWIEKQLLNLGFITPVPRWPNKKKACACLSHDVDYPEIIRWLEPLHIILRQGLSGLHAAASVLAGTRTHWHFPSWIHEEKCLGVRSAFYFAARQGSLFQYASGIPDPFYNVKSKRFRNLFRSLSNEGFEIGLHASYLAYKSQDNFSMERRILQECSDQDVSGNRHHYWHLNPNDIESTLMLHEQIGLKYDTSLTHERYLGWRRGLSFPFFPFHQAQRRQLKTLQMPTAWMDDQLFGYLNHNPGNRLETLQKIIDKTAEHGSCIVVSVHNYVFDDTLFPDWRKTYLWFVKNLVDRSDFLIGKPEEIADHWIKRYSSIFNLSHGLREGL
jgi:hypothetical protein